MSAVSSYLLLSSDCILRPVSESLVLGSVECDRNGSLCYNCCKQHPDHLALSILNGHNALVSGSYKHAVGETCQFIDTWVCRLYCDTFWLLSALCIISK